MAGRLPAFVPCRGSISRSPKCAPSAMRSTRLTWMRTGHVAGEFPEQMVYLEWLNSSLPNSSSCQACHMPQAQGGVQLSITGGPKRSPFFQHIFTGGNIYMLSMLRSNGEALGASASPEDFKAAIEQTAVLLAEQTAKVGLAEMRLENGRLSGQVQVQNLSGHKFPTSYPSRRAWLHLTVLDGGGALVFESGAWKADGSIPGMTMTSRRRPSSRTTWRYLPPSRCRSTRRSCWTQAAK